MTTNVQVEDKVLDGTFNGPVTVELRSDMAVGGIDDLAEFKQDITNMNNAAIAEAQQSINASMEYAADSKESAQDAEASAVKAKNSELAARGHADRAKTEADRASQISGLETVKEAVAQALAEGGYMWRTQADMEAMIAANEAMFAASGIVHWGRHTGNPTYKAINQGLTSYEGTSGYWINQLQLGSSPNSSMVAGLSKTSSPIINMGGFVTELKQLNRPVSEAGNSSIKFSGCEEGTRVFDSFTGTSIDYLHEEDPKYGNIAPTHEEAVARAFEGGAINGDFRLGEQNWSTIGAGGGTTEFTNGRCVLTSAADSLNSFRIMQQITEDNLKVTFPNSEIVTTVVVSFNSALTQGRVQIYGHGTGDRKSVYFGTNQALNEPNKLYTIEVTTQHDAPFEIQIQNQSQVPGAKVTVHSVSTRAKSQEVVINRVDMWGFEGWLEQVTAANPFVYDRGLPQSQATTIDGIATSYSNRPNSYYAVYDGDTSSKGRGVNFLALSVLEQDLIASNPKNNIYRMANGDIVQWRVRQVSVAGIGNGDWPYLTDGTIYTPAGWSGSNSVKCGFAAQGHKDSLDVEHRLAGKSGDCFGITQYTEESKGVLRPVAWTSQLGWHARTTGNIYGYNSLCYFLVGGTVTRLNKGGYHQSLNPLGANPWKIEGSLFHNKWYFPGSRSESVTSVKDAFDREKFIGDFSKVGQNNTALIGRIDGRVYDGIYAGGAGGVVDMRFSSWDASSSEMAAEISARVKAGTYRGLEKLTRTEFVIDDVQWNRYSGGNQLRLTTLYNRIGSEAYGTISKVVFDGKVYNVVGKSGTILTLEEVPSFSASDSWRETTNASGWYTYAFKGKGNSPLLVEYSTDISVSGEFTQTDIIGDPAILLQCKALRGGWLGGWIPVVPDGTSKVFPLTRKAVNLESAQRVVTSTDGGATWVTGATTSINEEQNAFVNKVWYATDIVFTEYAAFAKQTVPYALSLTVHNKRKGVVDLFATGDNRSSYGCLTMESLIGKIGTLPAGWGSHQGGLETRGLVITNEAKLQGTSYAGRNMHSQIEMTATDTAVKFLTVQVSNRGIANLGIVFNQIRAVADDDWGDGSKLQVFPATNTFTNDNSKTCLAGTAVLAIPYGWIKNQV